MQDDPAPHPPASALAANPVTILGAWVTTLSVFALVTYLALESFGLLVSPYAGLFGFIVVPFCFLAGLLLIPIGLWIESRRRRRGRAAWRWPTIDLTRSRTRVTVGLLAVLSVTNLVIVAVAGVGAAHYSESNSFCGQVCHEPMEPQFTAHALSAHAAVDCVQCHIAPGASGALAAKMNGTRQLYELLTNSYSRPISAGRSRLPMPAETCSACHAPMSPDRAVRKVWREHKDNETSSEILTTLMIYSGKAHWHARADVNVEYVAADDSLATIPYVRVTEGGATTEYFAEGVTGIPAGRPVRLMDCLDCHNRPAHTLASTPAQVVDRAIASGEVSTAVPYVRRELVDALSAEYPEGADAPALIVERLGKVFGDSPAAQRAVEAGARLYRQNVFPKMKVTWGTYSSNLSHVNDTGCFRCHDDLHATKADPEKKVRQECELCHLEQ